MDRPCFPRQIFDFVADWGRRTPRSGQTGPGVLNPEGWGPARMGYDLVQSTLISVHPNSRRTVPGRSGVGFTAATARWPLPAHTSGLILLNSCPDRTSRPDACHQAATTAVASSWAVRRCVRLGATRGLAAASGPSTVGDLRRSAARCEVARGRCRTAASGFVRAASPIPDGWIVEVSVRRTRRW
jgi:hypothetical protein